MSSVKWNSYQSVYCVVRHRSKLNSILHDSSVMVPRIKKYHAVYISFINQILFETGFEDKVPHKLRILFQPMHACQCMPANACMPMHASKCMCNNNLSQNCRFGQLELTIEAHIRVPNKAIDILT